VEKYPHLSKLPLSSDKMSLLSRPIMSLHCCIKAAGPKGVDMIEPWPSCGSSPALPSSAPPTVRPAFISRVAQAVCSVGALQTAYAA
ncbi:hypothetical protein CCH79_00021003, partial [Gambusia affinis]